MLYNRDEMVDWTHFYPEGLPRSSDRFNPDPMEAHRLVVATIRAGESILEVGCSTGYVSEYLTKTLGCRVTAIETNPFAAATTRARVGIPVIEPASEMAELPMECAQTFDVILCADVIEHVSDPARFLRHLLRYLRPEGRVIISTPNVAHWTSRWLLLRGRFDYEEQGIRAADHLRFFTRSSLIRLLSEVGLEPRSMRYSAGRWLPQYDRRILRPLRRRAVLAALIRRWPTLFGLQFVVEAMRR